LIYIIPDTQVKPGVKNPLIPIAYHICTIRPKHVIHLGDHWDFPSLSKYDKGKKSHRTKSYLKDLRAGNKAMEEFWEIIYLNWPNAKDTCTFTLFQGNHEERRVRALEYGPDELMELITEFPMDTNGWDEVIPFLEIKTIEGIYFTHYFQNMNNSYAIGTAKQLLSKKMCSCIAGHKQGFEYYEQIAQEGKTVQCMIIGSCYFHREEYKKHNNHHFRGVVILTNVRLGMFDFSRYSLENLGRHYPLDSETQI